MLGIATTADEPREQPHARRLRATLRDVLYRCDSYCRTLAHSKNKNKLFVFVVVLCVSLSLLLIERRHLHNFLRSLGPKGIALALLVFMLLALLLMLLYNATLQDFAPIQFNPIFCSIIARPSPTLNKHERGSISSYKATSKLSVDAIYAQLWFKPDTNSIVLSCNMSETTSKHAALPRLRQLLRLVSARATPHQVMLDLCGSGWHKAPDAIDRLVRCVNSFNVASRVVIASYEVPLLERISHSFPSVALCLLVEERDECLPIAHLASLAKQSGSWQIVLPERDVNSFVVAQLRELGLDCICNCKDGVEAISNTEMTRLIECGLSGVLTSFPQRWNETLDELRYNKPTR